MKKSIQEMNNTAIGYIGESIAKKLLIYSRRCIFSDFQRIESRYSALNHEIRIFLKENWKSFDLVRIFDKPTFKVQIIEVKTSTKGYKFRNSGDLCLTPKTFKLYEQARKLGIEILFLHLVIPDRWEFYYTLKPLILKTFGVCKGGYGKQGFIKY